jgi:hypothetical protein
MTLGHTRGGERSGERRRLVASAASTVGRRPRMAHKIETYGWPDFPDGRDLPYAAPLTALHYLLQSALARDFWTIRRVE